MRLLKARPRRSALGVGAIALVVLICGACASASAAGLVTVPIPGLSGPSARVIDAQRTVDGGAIFVAKIAGRPGATIVGRLQADGTLVLSYGDGGLARLGLAPTFQPSALAIAPATGLAWIAGSAGATSEIVALSADGEPAVGFGDRGIVRLPQADAGRITALAWRPGRLAVAAGTVQVTLNPSTGATLTSNRTDGIVLGETGCPRPAVAAATQLEAAPGARLVTLVPLSGSACGALIDLGEQGAFVVQATAGFAAPSITALPAGFVAQAMFRCVHHLLAIGTVGPGQRRSAELVTIPIALGPFALSIRRASASTATATTGCTR